MRNISALSLNWFLICTLLNVTKGLWYMHVHVESLAWSLTNMTEFHEIFKNINNFEKYVVLCFKDLLVSFFMQYMYFKVFLKQYKIWSSKKIRKHYVFLAVYVPHSSLKGWLLTDPNTSIFFWNCLCMDDAQDIHLYLHNSDVHKNSP